MQTTITTDITYEAALALVTEARVARRPLVAMQELIEYRLGLQLREGEYLAYVGLGRTDGEVYRWTRPA